MAYEVKKTEHSGAKKGKGFWGTKSDAKFQSSRIRRKNAEKQIDEALDDTND